MSQAIPSEGLAAILAAIEAAGEAEIARLRAETASRVQQVLAEAERLASARREQARQAALLLAVGERARRLHQAKLEALHVIGEVRQRLIDTALAETRRRLVNLRSDPAYPLILRRLTEEAIAALSEEGPAIVLEADPRDEALLRRILDALGLDVPLSLALECWGGVVARSQDGRVVAINTLEARLERATPFLRRDLAAQLEALSRQSSVVAQPGASALSQAIQAQRD
jgi:vacuolar-type H+-ATPase subunit E/Vma4